METTTKNDHKHPPTNNIYTNITNPQEETN